MENGTEEETGYTYDSFRTHTHTHTDTPLFLDFGCGEKDFSVSSGVTLCLNHPWGVKDSNTLFLFPPTHLNLKKVGLGNKIGLIEVKMTNVLTLRSVLTQTLIFR